MKKVYKTILKSTCLFIFLFAAISFANAQTQVSGKVTDAKDGSPVSGITVSVKGTKVAAATAADGSFNITAPATAKTLVFSSVGFQRQEVAIYASSNYNVALQSTSSSLNEIVVVGYGSKQKRDLTGSVTSVTSKDFQKGSITSPEQLIAGKVAGVSVISNGGAPGSGSTIRIRGGASISATNDPLIVIDGVPLDYGGISGSANALNLINPNDIESFSILKDASAAAIYGSRASNGVIIITTKKGNIGKPKFNFSTLLSVSKIVKEVDVLTADELRNYVKSHGTAANLALLGSANTNWQDQIYHTAITTDNNFSVSGGVKGLPYRVSVGYLSQQGILKTGKLDRVSASINISPRLFNDHLKVDLNLKGSHTNNTFANEGAIGSAVYFNPTLPVYSTSKRYGGYYEILDSTNPRGLKALATRNPLGLLNQREDKSQVDRSIGNIQFDYKIPFLTDLHANLNLGYDIAKGKGTIVVNDSAASDYRRSPNSINGGVNNQYLQQKQNSLVEFFLNYGKELKSINSHLDLLAGYSYQDFLTKNTNFPDVTYNKKDTLGRPTFPDDKFQHTLISYYGRVNYSLLDRYLLTGSIRTDGSSRFAPNYRWGVFPSGAFAWKIKQESFLKDSKAISDLKLRIGYGITGQQEGIGLYDFISYYALGDQRAQYQLGNTFYSVYRPGGYYPGRKWEETQTTNAGLDFGFANNRITGTLDYYFKKTKDLLSPVNQPAGTNFSNTIVGNVGSMTNEGVEVAFNITPIKTHDVIWDFNINATYNVNKITNLTISNDPNYIGNKYYGVGIGNSILINSVGYSRGSFYVYKQVYDSLGKPVDNVFVDRNGDGRINDKDLYRYKSGDPKWFFGFTNNVSYKQWSLGFVMRANVGNYIYNNVESGSAISRNILNPLGFINNSVKSILQTNFTGSGDTYFLSDYYIQNASFLRMDNLNIGYNFGKVLKGAGTLTITGNVQNVFVVTKYKGLDPEVSSGVDNTIYPRPRTYSIGLNLGFK